MLLYSKKFKFILQLVRMNIVFQNIKIINKKTIIGILSYTNDGSYLAEMEGFDLHICFANMMVATSF